MHLRRRPAAPSWQVDIIRSHLGSFLSLPSSSSHPRLHTVLYCAVAPLLFSRRPAYPIGGIPLRAPRAAAAAAAPVSTRRVRHPGRLMTRAASSGPDTVASWPTDGLRSMYRECGAEGGSTHSLVLCCECGLVRLGTWEVLHQCSTVLPGNNYLRHLPCAHSLRTHGRHPLASLPLCFPAFPASLLPMPAVDDWCGGVGMRWWGWKAVGGCLRWDGSLLA